VKFRATRVRELNLSELKSMLNNYKRLRDKLPQALMNATERLVNEAIEKIGEDEAHYSIEKLPTTNSSGKIEGRI